MNKKKLRFIINLLKIICIIVFFVFVFRKIDLKMAFGVLRDINAYAFLYFAIVFFVLFMVTFRWREILKTKGVKPRLFDLFCYKLSELYMNYITPSAFVGGEPVKAYLLKKNYKVEYSMGVSTAIIDKSFDIIINLIIGTIVFLLVLFKFVNKFGIIFTCFIAFFLFVAISFLIFAVYNYSKGRKILHSKIKFLKRKNKDWSNKVYNFIVEFEEHVLDFFHKEKDALLKSIMISVIISMAMYLEYFFLLKTLGIPFVSGVFPIVVLSMLGIAYMLPLPAAIGTLEIFETIAFVMFRLPPETAIAFVIFIRIKDILLALLGILYMSFSGVKIFKVKDLKEEK